MHGLVELSLRQPMVKYTCNWVTILSSIDDPKIGCPLIVTVAMTHLKGTITT